MASKIIIACGIPIPNGNMEYKSDGLGQGNGAPDGYRVSTNYAVDQAFGRVKARWATVRRGDALYPSAPIYASRGRSFSFGLTNLATADTGRYIETPPSPPGYLWGAEANDPYLSTNDFWWVRLRMWWRGFGVAPGASAAWSAQVIGYSNAAESASFNLCSIPLNGVSDWGTGWVLKASTPFKVNVSIHHIRVRLVLQLGALTTGTAYGCFTDLSCETLGPVDAAAGAGGAEINNPTYAAEGNGGTYYQMSRDRLWEGFENAPERLGKGVRMPSGSWRWFDSSGGSIKRRFRVPLKNLSRADADKLLRLHLACKGQSSDPGSFYGTPFPLLFSPQQPDDMGFYYVTMPAAPSPVEQDGPFQSATEAGTLYRCMLELVEV